MATNILYDRCIKDIGTHKKGEISIHEESYGEMNPEYWKTFEAPRAKLLHWIEDEKERHYISIGRRYPFDNKVWIRVPMFIARFFNQLF